MCHFFKRKLIYSTLFYRVMRTMTDAQHAELSDVVQEATPNLPQEGAELTIAWAEGYSPTREEYRTPSGIAGNRNYISDLVRCDDTLRSLIAERSIKGVPVYTSYGEERGTRYIIPMRKGEILVSYEQKEPVPMGSIYDDEEEHTFITYYFKNGRAMPI